MELTYLLSQLAQGFACVEAPEDTIDTTAQYARIAVNADDAGIILMHARHKIETPAGTTPRVDQAHQLQGAFGEGPGLAAIESGEHTYIVGNTLDDQRWPRWGKAASELGYASVISSALETQERRFGSLNVYSHATNAFSHSDAAVVRLLATYASVAVAGALQRTELQQGLGTRTLIGQAQGILMHAYDIDADQAFAYLRRISQNKNVKLVKVAEAILEHRDDLGDLVLQPSV